MCSNIPDCESCAQREADEQAIERLQGRLDETIGQRSALVLVHRQDLRRALRLAKGET